MKNLGFGRVTLSGCAAGALLAGCGGLQTMNATPADESQALLAHHQTFHYTGNVQFFNVPVGVKWVTVVALGAAGGHDRRHGTVAGHGGRVFAEIPVVQGEKLAVFVGGTAPATHTYGGYNGGGSGGYSGDGQSEGGGGATDIREGGDSLRHRILVAGGGGGFGEYGGHGCSVGGEGGGATGGSGARGCGGGYGGSVGGGGSGGAQKHGGSGGSGGTGSRGYGEPGASGSLGKGGSGGEGGDSDSGAAGDGGGGGGGYYGGGGGGGGGSGFGGWGDGGGGGGGSSYIESSARKYESWQGWKNATGNGLVVFSW
jgi:hypothetical protein